jgi:S-adenosylmethionine:tRNA ribosyltransferase-isomerase
MSILHDRPTTVFRSPIDLTADAPPEARGEPRDSVRLLVATPDGVTHTTFRHLDRFLSAGDVLVINTSATVPGQVDAFRRARATAPAEAVEGLEPVVVHIANRLADGNRVVELRSAPDASHPVLDGRAGERLALAAGGSVALLEPYPYDGSSPIDHGNRLWRARVEVGESLADYLDRVGRPISYGYLRERFRIEQYQTVFSLHPGSAEMPSAGRPFTPDLVTRLVAIGVVFAPVTLHTSVSSTEVGEGPLAEWFSVSPESAGLINAAKAAGRRVIAVGTTATRAVESVADRAGFVRSGTGWTEIVISSLRPIRTIDGLITGWHDPEASHLLLVEGVAGPELTQQGYDAAVDHRYRWHEFGDSGLFLP